MWVCLNNAFVSIVSKPGDGDILTCRARRAGDLERAFGADADGIVQRTPGRDYAYRVRLPRDVVAAALMCHVLGLSYGNFKDSVKDKPLHDAYMGVWSIMGRLQPGGPYGSGLRGGRRQRPLPLGHNYGPRDAAAYLHPADRLEEPVDLWDAGDIGGAIDARDLGVGAGLAFPLDELPRATRRKAK